MFFAVCFSAEAQQPKRVPRIGFLHDPSSSLDRFEVFRQGLHELGYVEGKSACSRVKYPGSPSSAIASAGSSTIILQGGQHGQAFPWTPDFFEKDGCAGRSRRTDRGSLEALPRLF